MGGGGVPKSTGNAPRGGSIEGSPSFIWVVSSDLDRLFIRPVVPLVKPATAFEKCGFVSAGRGGKKKRHCVRKKRLFPKP